MAPRDPTAAIRDSLERIWSEPANVSRDVGQRALIDFLGCVNAGARTPFVQQLRETVLMPDNNDVLHSASHGIPAATAALVNGAAAHAQDFDDTHWSSTAHPSAVIWASLLSCSLREVPVGTLVDGYRSAVSFLSDLGPWVCPAHIRRGWHSTGTVAGLAATVALLRVRMATLTQAEDALGLAGSLIGGLRGNNASSAKALQAGRGAQAAVMATQVSALQGFSGQTKLEALTDAFSFASTGQEATPDLDVVFKPWPTCTGTHAAIEAALQLRRQEDRADEVLVEVPAVVGEETTNTWPTHLAAARLCLPFVIAVVDTFGTVGEAELNAGLGDQAVRRAFDRVSVRKEPPTEDERYHVDTALTMRWGREEERVVVEHPYGDPWRPMTDADLRAKFRYNARGRWGPSRQDELLAAVESSRTDAVALLELARGDDGPLDSSPP